jgi:hypothetical protein
MAGRTLLTFSRAAKSRSREFDAVNCVASLICLPLPYALPQAKGYDTPIGPQGSELPWPCLSGREAAFAYQSGIRWHSIPSSSAASSSALLDAALTAGAGLSPVGGRNFGCRPRRLGGGISAAAGSASDCRGQRVGWRPRLKVDCSSSRRSK